MSVAEDRTTLDELCVNTIRTLSMDAVQKANSGHPGHADGARAARVRALHAGDAATRPSDPQWPDRDRFVLSCGHASMLLYSTLYLTGYGLTLDDLKNFRQLGSPTAGHPEYGHAAGIETTTGPLGQGISTAVGMALAERMLAARFNREGHEIVDHYTYVIASDGDLQEGVPSEASSLAGHLGLGRLIAFCDDNHISIEGDTALVVHRGRRHALRGLRLARPEPRRGHRARPASRRRWPTPRGRRGPAVADRRPHPHRPGLAEQAGHARRARLAAGRRGDQAHQGGLRLARAWSRSSSPTRRSSTSASAIDARRGARGRVAASVRRLPRRASRARPRSSSACSRASCPTGWDADVPKKGPDAGMIATRKASQDVIQWAAAQVPELVGGSADLAPVDADADQRRRRASRTAPTAGRNFHFGIREHGMGAIVNGLVLQRLPRVRRRLLHLQRLHEGVDPARRDHAASRRPSCSRTTRSASARTARPTSRSSSSPRCARRRTSTSCGPRASTRPRWRGASRCSATETPTAFALSRQGVPVWDPAGVPDDAIERGAYVLQGRRRRAGADPDGLRHRGPHRPRRG